jgi:serine/threonine-protein kinase
VASKLPADCAEHYRVERLLGAGGFGAVYRATQVGLERPVAVKVLSREVLDDPEQRERFSAEARVTATLSSAHIVRVLDHGAATGVPWIAYELLEGRSLRQVLEERGRLAPDDAIRAAAHVAAALEEAHAKGIVHRDIKPDNVLESRPGHHVVTDFGIARWTEGSRVKTRTGVILGTPAYLAPEVVSGEAAGAPADLYALGVMLHELVAGRPPFVDDSLFVMLERHLKSDPPPTGVPAVDEIVRRAMAKRPAQRFESALAFRAALERLLEPAPRELMPPRTRPRSRASARNETIEAEKPRPAGRLAIARALPALALAGVLAGTLVVLVIRPPEPDPAPPVPVSASPSGSASASVSAVPAAAELETWLARLPEGDPEATEAARRLAELVEVQRPIGAPRWLSDRLFQRLQAAVAPTEEKLEALVKKQLASDYDSLLDLVVPRERRHAIVRRMKEDGRTAELEELRAGARAALTAADAYGPALLALDLPPEHEMRTGFLLAATNHMASVLQTGSPTDLKLNTRRWTQGRPESVALHGMHSTAAQRLAEGRKRMDALRAALAIAVKRLERASVDRLSALGEISFLYAQLSDACRETKSPVAGTHEIHLEWLEWHAAHPADSERIRAQSKTIVGNCKVCSSKK